MIDVCDGDVITQFSQHERHANGISAAGHSGKDPVAWSKQMVFLDCFADVGWKIRRHGEMPEGGLEPPT